MFEVNKPLLNKLDLVVTSECFWEMRDIVIGEEISRRQSKTSLRRTESLANVINVRE